MTTTEVKERPILFSSPMVRAILDGKKTETRRLVKSEAKNMQAGGQVCIRRNPDNDPWYKQHVWSVRGKSGVWGDYTEEQMMTRCPYGKPGDRLWVRETWAVDGPLDLARARHEDALRGSYVSGFGPYYLATEPSPDSLRWRPSIFMPRWACRITLEVTKVRVEQLQAIRERGCRAEGCAGGHDSIPSYPFSATPLEHYRSIWSRVNGEKGWRSWDANPWVWVVEFRRVAA